MEIIHKISIICIQAPVKIILLPKERCYLQIPWKHLQDTQGSRKVTNHRPKEISFILPHRKMQGSATALWTNMLINVHKLLIRQTATSKALL